MRIRWFYHILGIITRLCNAWMTETTLPPLPPHILPKVSWYERWREGITSVYVTKKWHYQRESVIMKCKSTPWLSQKASYAWYLGRLWTGHKAMQPLLPYIFSNVLILKLGKSQLMSHELDRVYLWVILDLKVHYECKIKNCVYISHLPKRDSVSIHVTQWMNSIQSLTLTPSSRLFSVAPRASPG